MKVLVTGAAGFIGAAVCNLLAGDGHEVVGVDALIPQAHTDLPDVAADLHLLDVRDAARWQGLLRGVDVVCHQAAMVGAGVTVSDLPAYAAHNDLGTACLLAAMHGAGVRRLVLASSMVVYGEGRYSCAEHGSVRPLARSGDRLADGFFEPACPVCADALSWELVDEDAPMDPRSAYAASKVAQEHYVSAWVRQAGATALALRYHNVYGPGMPRDTPYSGVAAIFRSSLEAGRRPRVFEDGGQMRDFVHVADVAEANRAAVLAVCDESPSSYDAFNVCSGTPVSVLDVARLVGASASVEPEVTGETRPGDVRHIVASPERAAARLGFQAVVDPARGLAAFAADPLR